MTYRQAGARSRCVGDAARSIVDFYECATYDGRGGRCGAGLSMLTGLILSRTGFKALHRADSNVTSVDFRHDRGTKQLP